ncbi:MAG: hypothetical protein KGI67_10820 [Pseudomonadota bacterium]|nr:hypothetical protein [Pseudomonadota bacterium]
MLKQVTVTLDTSDPLQAQWLVEYLASPDRSRFGRTCLLLGFLAATGNTPVAVPAEGSVRESDSPRTPASAAPGDAQRRRGGIGSGLFGLD